MGLRVRLRARLGVRSRIQSGASVSNHPLKWHDSEESCHFFDQEPSSRQRFGDERRVLSTADCYRLLELGTDASYGEIKVAYRRLARALHPDVNPEEEAADRFIAITAAYQHLLTRVDPETIAPPPPKTRLTPDQELKQAVHEQLQSLLRAQKLPRAIAVVDALSGRFPSDPEIRQWQALIYQRWGRQLIGLQQLDQAERYLEKALKTDPHNRSLLAEIAQDMRQIKRSRRAAELG
jgi:tetratricopeptide (TPR) repeat protein